MARLIFVLGHPGTGKTTSLRSRQGVAIPQSDQACAGARYERGGQDDHRQQEANRGD